VAHESKTFDPPYGTTWKMGLGVTVTDTVTGFAGVVTARAEYSTGCKQYLVSPSVDKDGSYREGLWFDEDRLFAAEVDERTYGSDFKPVGGPQRNPAPVK